MSKTYDDNGGGGMTFYTIFDGKITNRVQEGTEGAVGRELQKGSNAGKMVYEVYHSAVGGMITNGGIVVKEFGGKKIPEVQIMLDDDAMLQLPMYLLKNIAEVLPNVDPLLEVKIGAYKTKAGKIGLNVSQPDGDGAWKQVESHFTEWVDGKPKNINGLPEPTHDEIDGWDFRDHDKFLKGVVIDFFELFHGDEDNSPF